MIHLFILWEQTIDAFHESLSGIWHGRNIALCQRYHLLPSRVEVLEVSLLNLGLKPDLAARQGMAPVLEGVVTAWNYTCLVRLVLNFGAR